MDLDSRPLPELPLDTGTLLVSDLHLDVTPAAPAETAQWFAAWLVRQNAPRLVVLGDLFDAWIGPAQVRTDAARTVLEAMSALARRGTALDVIPGNRDFLLDGSFERASGARVFGRGMVGRVGQDGEERVLLIHGDELCTLDLPYQRLKRVLRSRAVLGAAPWVPAPLALWIARRLRRASMQALETKPAADQEQQQDAVRCLCGRHGCGALVCGHAHRSRDVRLPGGPRWLVLGAFGEGRDLVRVGPAGALQVLDAARAGAVSP